MTLNQLRILVAIVDAGYNITHAAERVHATQPGLSKQLKQLEEYLGLVLLVRRGKSLTGLTPAGERVVVQRGIPGFKTMSSRVVRDGAYAVRDRWSDSYPPTTQIIHVGSGPADTSFKAVDDTHPEYVVDEYLVVTQGPEIHTPGASGPEPGGGTTESREPGKTGDYGWTEKAGLTRYHAKDSGKPDETLAEGARPAKGSGDKDKSDKDKADKGSKADKSDSGDKPKKKKKKKKPDAP